MRTETGCHAPKSSVNTLFSAMLAQLNQIFQFFGTQTARSIVDNVGNGPLSSCDILTLNKFYAQVLLQSTRGLGFVV